MAPEDDGSMDLSTGTLPVLRVVGVVAIAVVITLYIANVQSKASAAEGLADQQREFSASLHKIEGKIDVLLDTREDVVEIKTIIQNHEQRFQSLETRIQTQDAWIQTTRERLLKSGFEPPPYKREDP